MATVRPNYIPDTIASRGADFIWRGKREHIGPVETRTKLMDKFAGITSCGCFCIASGLLTWTSFRFGHLLDVSSTERLAEGALAFMADPLSLDIEALMEERVPDQPPVVSAYRELRWFGSGAIYPGRWFKNADTPTRELFHFAYLLRYLLDPASAAHFDDWIDAVTKNLQRVAPKPEVDESLLSDAPKSEEIHAFVAPHWGIPLPLAILSGEVAPGSLSKAVLEEARLIDWKANPYVRHAPDFSIPYGRAAS